MTDRLVDQISVAMPRNYLRSCLLLLLAEGTSHGYELLDQVAGLGFDRVDPGGLYRCLRAMDQEGLVCSTWQPSTSGPARRTYSLSESGREWLDASVGPLAEMARSLAAYQRRYLKLLAEPERPR